MVRVAVVRIQHVLSLEVPESNYADCVSASHGRLRARRAEHHLSSHHGVQPARRMADHVALGCGEDRFRQSPGHSFHASDQDPPHPTGAWRRSRCYVLTCSSSGLALYYFRLCESFFTPPPLLPHQLRAKLFFSVVRFVVVSTFYAVLGAHASSRPLLV